MIFHQQLKSIVTEGILDDPKADKKTAKRVGQYKVSEKAIYRPDDTYLPFSAVQSITHDRTSVHVSGCCAGGVWVERLIFETKEGRFPFIFDRAGEIERVKEISGIEIE